MAKISPFLSRPEEWVENLAALREERKKIEEREGHLRDKILGHLRDKSLESIASDRYEAKIERRESTDFSQAALAAEFGTDWLAAAKKRLPIRQSESLRLTARQSQATGPAERDFVQEIDEKFAPGPKPSKSKARKA